jgi:hypothetical protein
METLALAAKSYSFLLPGEVDRYCASLRGDAKGSLHVYPGPALW